MSKLEEFERERKNERSFSGRYSTSKHVHFNLMDKTLCASSCMPASAKLEAARV
jgi:hypothetical protein